MSERLKKQPDEQKLFSEALSLAVDFVFEDIDEFPNDRFREIGQELHGSIHYIEDLSSLRRIAIRARGKDE